MPLSFDVFDIPPSLLRKVKNVLEGKEENPERSPLEESEKEKQVAIAPKEGNDGAKVLMEKGKKKKVDEGEKIILNPEVHPDRITEPDKVQKTV
jgi:hypothetical protein